MKKYSKFLSFVLRHEPDRIGIRLDAQGWVAVDDLLAGLAAAGKDIDRAKLETIVATSEKKRFTLSEDGVWIRAAQGHSVKVDLGLEAVEPPETLYHGTATKSIDAIMAEGLKPRSRQQVHLSQDIETATKVGARHGDPVILTVAAGQMHRDGCIFNRAENGVWLTDTVPTAYLTK